MSRAIMVIAANLTPFAKQCLLDLMPKLHIEQFTENELLVNITEHVLVPEHRILSREEKQVLLDRYKVKETQLPRIQVGACALYEGVHRRRARWGQDDAAGTAQIWAKWEVIRSYGHRLQIRATLRQRLPHLRPSLPASFGCTLARLSAV